MLCACLGGPQVGDDDSGNGGSGGGNPSNREVVLAPKNGEGGIRLFSSVSDGGSVIETNNIAPIAVAERRTRDANGAFADARSEFVVYEDGGKILKVDVAISANTTAPVQVSSESEACGAGTLYQNDPDAGLAMYVYTSQGADDACGTNDDPRRAVRLSMTSADTALTLPAAETIVTQLTDGAGALVGWLMFDGTTLGRYSTTFTNRQSVAGGAVVTTPDPPQTRDANGVLFQIGSDLRYYNQNANTLSDSPLFTKAAAAQFGVFRHDATHTYFTEFDASETRVRALLTSGGAVALLAQQPGNTSTSLELTTNRVIYQLPDGTVRSIAKDGTDAVNVRTPASGALLSFTAVNNALVITETTTQTTLSVHGEASATPTGSSRSNTVLAGFTKASSGNLFGSNRSKIIAVRRLTNAATDASGAVIALDPATAVEVNLGTLSTQDLRFVTDALQTGDFSSAYSLSGAGGALQRMFLFNAATASSLRVVQ
jgi:hypothetical protein